MIRKFAIALLLLALQVSVLPAAADTGVRIVVPNRDIARGETITDKDLTFATVPGSALMAGTVTSIAAAKDMEARRMLHAGEAMRGDDLRHPIVVTRGQTVTMLFHAPGVELTAMGRSMGEGGVGDAITVQNPASFRMIAGVITAPGTVLATGPASPSPQQRTARY
ncbi:MAG TPA: flagellar basal body P-ring formation chaperone FlgA [Rhizomicrobium sp.]|jgi:flagella basal body P-ring formation protein FlgA|nr:flagellar basal body P-ring formation chaperone FlgA [Rhizomicrobium sp.]